MSVPFVLTPTLVTRVLEIVDQGLSSGLGSAKPGHMCVEAAVCYAMGLPHGDNPTCVHPAIRVLKIRLNDSKWSSNNTRAAGMRKLAVLQLGTKESEFDQRLFAEKISIMTVRTVLPPMLRSCGLEAHAAECEDVTTTTTAARAASDAAYAARAAARAASDAASDADAARAAARAAYAARVAANAAYAATNAAYAANAAAKAADNAAANAAAKAANAANAANAADKILSQFAENVSNILIEMNVPAVAYLHLLKG